MKLEHPEITPQQAIRAARHNLRMAGLPELTFEEERAMQNPKIPEKISTPTKLSKQLK